jgi:myo-inositol-1(or 4)-monophosphatase
MQPMANIALRAARKAADYLARSMDRPDQFEIQEKRHNDFVSNIDRNAEEIIIEQIRETYPNHRILAEESGEQSGDSEFTWVIDPLDGTLNFLQGIPHFAVSIGVMKGLHHEHGVIVDPVRGEEFVAMSRLEDYTRSLQTLTGTCRGIRRAGSAALDLAYVAAGRMDGFWEMGLSKWDIAAGIVLVREAGGFISDLSGGEKFWETGDIVAANPKCFKSFIQTLKA